MNNNNTASNQFIPKHHSLVYRSYLLDPTKYDTFDYQGAKATLLVYKKVSEYLLGKSVTTNSKGEETINSIKITDTIPLYPIECHLLIQDNLLYAIIDEDKGDCKKGEVLELSSPPITKSDFSNTFSNHHLMHVIEAKDLLVELFVHRNKEFGIPDSYNPISIYDILNNYHVGKQVYLVLEKLPDYPIRCTIIDLKIFNSVSLIIHDFYNYQKPGSIITLTYNSNPMTQSLLYITNQNEYGTIYLDGDHNTNPDYLPPLYIALKYSKLKESASYAGEMALLCVFNEEGETLLVLCNINVNPSVTIHEGFGKYPAGTVFQLRPIANTLEMMILRSDFELCKVFLPLSRL